MPDFRVKREKDFVSRSATLSFELTGETWMVPFEMQSQMQWCWMSRLMYRQYSLSGTKLIPNLKVARFLPCILLGRDYLDPTAITRQDVAYIRQSRLLKLDRHNENTHSNRPQVHYFGLYAIVDVVVVLRLSLKFGLVCDDFGVQEHTHVLGVYKTLMRHILEIRIEKMS